MADGYLNFDTKINTKGFSSGLSGLGKKLNGLKAKLKGIASAVASVINLKNIAAFAEDAKKAWQVQTEAETRLAQAMRNTMNATDSQIQAVKDYASELQKVGVIGDEVTLSGLQKLSTYLGESESLKKMSVVLDDMLAQQYGLNATAENAVTISTMLGKVLEGQTSALSRYGYKFDEAQEHLLKYGTEEQRVATLAEVVEQSVGGMNEALARTPAGRLKQISNSMGDVKEQFGQAFTNLSALFLPALEHLAAMLAEIADLAVRVSESLAELFGISLDDTAAVSANITASVTGQDDLTEATEETAKAQKKLISIDELHTVGGDEKTDNSPVESLESVAVAPEIDKKKTEKQANKLTTILQKLLEPIRLAWELDSPALIEQAKYTAAQIKRVFQSVAKSIETVWTNGSGLRMMRNLLHLSTDFLGVVGDISTALHRAWEDGGRGTKYIQSISDKWNAFLELVHTVTQSFRDAWNNGSGERIIGHILDILTGLNNITANLRLNFAAAWEEGGTGERIFDGILKTVDSVLNTFDGIIADTVEWSKDVDFGPLLEGLASLSEALAPLADTVGEGLRAFWNDVCLPMGKWLIETGIPGAITLITRGIEDLNAAIQALKPYFSWFVDELAKPVGNFLGDAFAVFTDADFRPSEIFEGLGEEIYDGTFWDTWAEGAKSMFSGTELTKNMEKFGEGVYDFFAGIGEAVSDLEHWLDSGFDAIDDFFIGIGKFFRDFEGELEGVGEAVYDTVHSIGEWFAGLWDGIRKTFSGIGKWFGEKFTAAKNAATKAFSNIGNWFSARWTDIKDAFAAAGAWFSETFKSAYAGICKVFASVGDWFSDRWDDIKNALSAVKTWFAEKFRAAYDAVCRIFSGIGQWYAERWADIKNVFAKVKDWFADKFQKAYDAVTGIFRSIGSWFSDRWADIRNVFDKIGTWFSDKFGKAYDAVTDAFKCIGNWFKARWDDITNAFSSVGDWFSEKFQKAYDSMTEIFSGVGEFFSGIWDGIGNGVKSIVNDVIGGLNWMLEKVESGVNAVIDGLNSIFSFSLPNFLGGHEFSIDLPHTSLPRIPYLAQGTVVPANYGNFLAVLGDNKREPEIVAPESAIRKAVAAELSALKTGGDITVKLVCDGRTLAQIVQKYDLKNRRAMNGG